MRFGHQKRSSGHDPAAFNSLFFGCQTRVWRLGIPNPTLKLLVDGGRPGRTRARGLGGSVRAEFLILDCSQCCVFLNSLVPKAASGSPPSWWCHSWHFLWMVSSRLFWVPPRAHSSSPFNNFLSTQFVVLNQWFLFLVLRHD